MRKARSILKYLRQPIGDLPGFHVLTPLPLPLYGIPLVRRLNSALIAGQVRRAAAKLGIVDPIYFLTLPTAWDIVREMPRRVTVYNRSDKHSEFSEAPQEYVRQIENQLLAESDYVLYVSRALMSAERDRVGDRGVFLDHGVDLDHMRRRPAYEEPADLAAIARPRIGFFGSFDDYTVDFALLEQVAVRFPRAQIVLIGDATCSMECLTRHANVHWLGFRPYEEIPRYGSGFDVALMPWLNNEWIKHCNPIKLKEYLALGLNIVSTYFPEIEGYRQHLRVANTAGEFLDLVELSLREGGVGSQESRRQAVAACSWELRTEQLLALCDGQLRLS